MGILEETMGEHLCDFGLGKVILRYKKKTLKEKSNNLNIIKI